MRTIPVEFDIVHDQPFSKYSNLSNRLERSGCSSDFKKPGKPSGSFQLPACVSSPCNWQGFDEIQSARLLKYLVKNKLISDHQYGFLPKRYTTTQLVFIVEKFVKALEEGDVVSAVFMDFAKAFDRVWHPGLLYKFACGRGKPIEHGLATQLSRSTIHASSGGVYTVRAKSYYGGRPARITPPSDQYYLLFS